MLMLYLWREFYPSRIHRQIRQKHSKSIRAFVYINDITELPREDHIKDIGAYIQNVQLKFPQQIKVTEKDLKILKNGKKNYMENKIYATILILITVYLGICVAS